MRPRVLLALALALVPTMSARPAAAQTSSVELEEARRQFALAVEDYQAGRLEDALVRFRRSHGLSGAPELLFNIATVLERLRRDAEALDAYERYLAARPDGDDHALVEARIRMLRTELAPAPDAPVEAVPAEAAPVEAAPPPADAPAPASTPEVGPWALGLGGGALVVAGGALAVVAALDAQAVAEATRWADAREPYERAPWASAAGIAGIGVGAAAIAGALAWHALTPGGADVAVALGPGSVAIRGHF